MSSQSATSLDMTMMYAVHDALRRDAAQVARIAHRAGTDPARLLRTAVGWEMFKGFLHVHHTSEDVTVWPVMRETLAERPDELALLDAMESEHAAIDPLVAGVDAALADVAHGHDRLADVVDELVSVLSHHLRHEEEAALPLIDSTLTPEQWKHFSVDHRDRIGTDASQYLPWLLDDADPARADLILARVPDEMRQAYHDEWKRNYARLDRWGPGHPPATA